MKNLESTFIGKGQVKGFVFTKVKESEFAFIYEVNTGNSLHYEVFEKKINTQFNCISYPRDNAFGSWAFTFVNLETAIIKFNEFNNEK